MQSLIDRFGAPTKPQEWFLVPLEVIEAAIDKIKQGTIDQFRYDRKTASLMQSKYHPRGITDQHLTD